MAKKVKIKSKKPQGIGSCVYQFFSVYQSGTGNTVPQRNQFRCLQGGIRESENLERL